MSGGDSARDEFDVDPEELRKQFWGDATTDVGATDVGTTPIPNGADESGWAAPDLSVLRLRRRDPPPLPLEVFG